MKSEVVKVGILGGGQLGRMLAMRGFELGYEVHIFSESPQDPAAQVTQFWHKGKIEDTEALLKFFRAVDVVTFESEFVSPEALEEANKETKVPVVPLAITIGLLRDRASQKELLVKNKAPTSPFIVPHSPDDLRRFWRECPDGVVCKKRVFGYDGYGTFLLRTQKELESFLQDQEGRLNEFIAEELVRFKRELAVSLVRDRRGKVAFLPLVEWRARDKKCHWVKGPVQHSQFQALKKVLNKFARSLDYQGVLSFELFDLGNRLYVNEIAPRVHNSAHYSLNALNYDQFQLHLIAVSGAPLPPVHLNVPAFAMVNLIGQTKNQPQLVRDTVSSLHWYGKSENRPGRKMGHLNTTARTADEALRIALREEKRFKL